MFYYSLISIAISGKFVHHDFKHIHALAVFPDNRLRFDVIKFLLVEKHRSDGILVAGIAI